MKNESKYGTVTVGYGTPTQREIEITEFIQCVFADHRLVSIAKMDTEEESYVLSVENPESTGRGPKSTIWLSKKSVIALINCTMLYLHVKGENYENLTDETIDGKSIKYTCSDNLTDKMP